MADPTKPNALVSIAGFPLVNSLDAPTDRVVAHPDVVAAIEDAILANQVNLAVLRPLDA